jgi:hypothetical protein
MSHLLNAFFLSFSADEFDAYKHELPNPKEVRPLRERVKADWFVHWKSGIAWGLPLMPNPKTQFGQPTKIKTNTYDGLSLLAARASAQLSAFLPQYVPLPGKGRGFRFVARNAEFVRQITEHWESVPTLLQHFEIRPRFICEARLIELQDAALRVALVVDISMRWDIQADLQALADAHIDLRGLHVIRRQYVPGQRSLLGQIKLVENNRVELVDGYDDVASVMTDDARLEPTKQSFKRCLEGILGQRARRFWDDYDGLQSEFLGGSGFNACLDRILPSLTKHSGGIYLAPKLFVSVGERIQLSDQPVPFGVNYCFDPGKTKRSEIPWSGLKEFGPYDRESFPYRAPNVLLVCPLEAQNRVEQAALKLKDGIPNSAFSRGFARTFHLSGMSFDTCPVSTVGATSNTIVSIYAKAIEERLQKRSDYAAALVVVGDQFSKLSDRFNPYLFAKAVLLMNGIPVQEAKLSTVTQSDDRLSWIFQNMSVALYAKMGGVPWTVNQDQTVNDEVIVGMGLVETSGSRYEEKQRVVGITTVFRGDGNYLLANVARECPFAEYRDQLRTTMVDVLVEVRQRNGWKPGDSVRVVFHASKPLRDLEIDELMHECVTQAAPEQVVQFAFIDVLQDHPFHVFDTMQTGKSVGSGYVKGAMAPARGFARQLGAMTWLLSTNGISQIKKPTTPLPSPLLVHLHKKSTGCDLPYLTDQVLKFTSLTWRSTQPASEPVTIYYSALIADLLTRLKAVPGWSPNVLNTKLRASKWFL